MDGAHRRRACRDSARRARVDGAVLGRPRRSAAQRDGRGRGADPHVSRSPGGRATTRGAESLPATRAVAACRLLRARRPRGVSEHGADECRPRAWRTPSRRPEPLRRVGCYVPGGRAAYPSTVLMSVIPAQAAGVASIVVTSPATGDGDVHPLVAAAAHLLGVDEVYAIGGAQAIAALAYGTKTIEAVDKVV